jgi:transposase-like protein
MSDGLNRCTGCRARTSVTAGTLLAGTRTPLRGWLRAAWYIINQKQGVSALGLKRALGLGRYETAWTWLHEFRRAMVRSGREQLAGELEIDETLLGGDRKPGRSAHGKAIVAIAVEVRPRGTCGRVRLARIRNSGEPAPSEFVRAAAAPGSVIYTDARQGDAGLEAAGFRHYATSLAASGEPAHVVMPRAHRVASLLKRWQLGTHQGAVRPHQLDFYLDQFTLRFNRRGSNHVGPLFYRLLEQALQQPPAPLTAITGGRP